MSGAISSSYSCTLTSSPSGYCGPHADDALIDYIPDQATTRTPFFNDRWLPFLDRPVKQLLHAQIHLSLIQNQILLGFLDLAVEGGQQLHSI